MKKTRKFIDENHIKHPEMTDEICESVLRDPILTEEQEDGRIRFWGIAEPFHDGEVYGIRVVTLEDGETLLSAFIDYRMTRQIRRQSN